jgi:hypothetical protein
VVQQVATTLLTQAPLLLVAGAIGIVRLGRRQAREVHWAAAWIVASVVGVIAQREVGGHALALAVPALAVIGALGVVDVARSLGARDSRALAAAALGGLALFTGNEALAWWRPCSLDAACLTGRMDRPDYLRALQTGGFSMADEEEAASRVRETTAPGDGILVWGLSPGLYALADRHPVTRVPAHKILLTDAPLSRSWPGLDRRRAAFMDRLRADPPAVVLVGQNDANSLEPQDSYASIGRFRELRAMLHGGYVSAPPVGRFLVYRRAAP